MTKRAISHTGRLLHRPVVVKYIIPTVGTNNIICNIKRQFLRQLVVCVCRMHRCGL